MQGKSREKTKDDAEKIVTGDAQTEGNFIAHIISYMQQYDKNDFYFDWRSVCATHMSL